jgi:hypothetical protein
MYINDSRFTSGKSQLNLAYYSEIRNRTLSLFKSSAKTAMKRSKLSGAQYKRSRKGREQAAEKDAAAMIYILFIINTSVGDPKAAYPDCC